ncbi:hypothetical protein Pelo_7178 [Pelomyxa schiedti]|nr:hypothetical protein Pelo_7178 [Pelomyxa schiedti]
MFLPPWTPNGQPHPNLPPLCKFHPREGTITAQSHVHSHTGSHISSAHLCTTCGSPFVQGTNQQTVAHLLLKTKRPTSRGNLKATLRPAGSLQPTATQPPSRLLRTRTTR